MGRPGPQTHAKRLREQAKRDKRHAKDARRAARKAAKEADKLPAMPDDDSAETSTTTQDPLPGSASIASPRPRELSGSRGTTGE